MDFTKSENHQSIEELAQHIFRDQVDDDYHKRGIGATNSASDNHADSHNDDPAQRGQHYDHRYDLHYDLQYDIALWKTLAEAGLLGAAIAEEHGGSGMSLLDVSPVFEAQGAVLARLPLWNSVVAGLAIQRFGSASQCENLLPDMIAGNSHFAIALADPARATLNARVTANDESLNGVCNAVAYAEGAAAILIPVVNGEGQSAVYLLPSEQLSNFTSATSSSGEPYSNIELNAVPLAQENILGEWGQGDDIVEWLLQHSYSVLAATQLGVVEEALTRTASYVSERHQFGKPLASFQAVSHRAADGYIDREALRSCVWQAAWRLGEGLDAAAESRSAKWWACEAGHRISHSCQHLHGGMGSDVDYPIHRYFLWAKQIEFTLGGASEQLAAFGAMLAANDQLGPAI